MVDWSGSLKTDIPFVCARLSSETFFVGGRFMADIAWMTIKVQLGGRTPGMFYALTIGMRLLYGAAMVVGNGMEKCLG